MPLPSLCTGWRMSFHLIRIPGCSPQSNLSRNLVLWQKTNPIECEKLIGDIGAATFFPAKAVDKKFREMQLGPPKVLAGTGVIEKNGTLDDVVTKLQAEKLESWGPRNKEFSLLSFKIAVWLGDIKYNQSGDIYNLAAKKLRSFLGGPLRFRVRGNILHLPLLSAPG